MKKVLLIAFNVSLIFLMISCKKDISKPFSKFNQKIIISLSVSPSETDTTGEHIDSLIYSKINTIPVYDSLPFGLKIGDKYETVIQKLIKLNLKVNFINDKNQGKRLEVISIIKSIKNEFVPIDKNDLTIDDFKVKSLIFFKSDKLVEIFQNIYIPKLVNERILFEENRINNLGSEYNYLKTKLSRTKDFETTLDVASDEFLKTYKAKYGEENYHVLEREYIRNEKNPQIENAHIRESEYLWLKKGVLISCSINNRFLKEDIYNQIRYYNNYNFQNLVFLNISYQGVKNYFDDKKLIYNNMHKTMDSVMKTMPQEQPIDSIINNKKSGL